ncbi:glycosyltransferase [Methanobacterium sp. ACI-7]|uniref:glycosyltransferase n=1 Tax=unclassified Methanobacterium TaxID=2627676 RepID=UPI0039C072AC
MTLIDIIVGVKNEEKYIKKCITSLQGQSISDIGIIVIDGLSSDRTREIVKDLMKKDKRIKLLTNENEIISSARNIGLKASNADFIAYIDGHTYVGHDWLKILYNAFLKYEYSCKLGCVGSTYAVPEDESNFGKVIDFCFKTLFGGFGTSVTEDKDIKIVDTVAFGIYRRSVLNEFGITYDEQMTHCEDTDFNYKLLKKEHILLKHPNALVYQYKRSNLKDFSKQMYNYGMGRARLFKKYHLSIKVFVLIPAFFVLYLILLIIFSLFYLLKIISGQILLITFIPAIIYLVVNTLYTLICIEKIKNIKAIIAFLIFPVEHIAYGMGFIKNLIL